MADKTETTEAKRENIWGSVQGTIKAGSLVKDEKGVAAIVVGDNGAELKIKGYGDKFAGVVEAAAAKGEPVIFQGHVLGSNKNGNVHLSVKIEGPSELKGTISNIKRQGEGKQPYVNFFLMREITSREGKEFKIGTPVSVYGAAAEALADLNAGDRVELQGRETKDGYQATSAVTVTPKAEPAPAPEEDDAPSM
jgi:hypothetical protein